MIRQIAVAASIALLGISGQAMAGQSVQLSNVNGSVLVNQNGRYVPVTNATTLRAGDRLVSMNGDASLVYADGCKVDLSAQSMATITDAPCAADSVVRAEFETAPGANASLGTMMSFPESKIPQDNVGGADMWLWLGFGVLTAVVVAAAFADDEDPVSA